jgi:hypothetical protein
MKYPYIFFIALAIPVQTLYTENDQPQKKIEEVISLQPQELGLSAYKKHILKELAQEKEQAIKQKDSFVKVQDKSDKEHEKLKSLFADLKNAYSKPGQTVVSDHLFGKEHTSICSDYYKQTFIDTYYPLIISQYDTYVKNLSFLSHVLETYDFERAEIVVISQLADLYKQYTHLYEFFIDLLVSYDTMRHKVHFLCYSCPSYKNSEYKKLFIQQKKAQKRLLDSECAYLNTLIRKICAQERFVKFITNSQKDNT